VPVAGVRWARNILVELLGNFGGMLHPAKRECMRVAITNLTDFDRARFNDQPEDPKADEHKRKLIRTFKGSKGNTYELRQGRDGVFYCTCPAWAFNKAKPQRHV
jgi:hypothetical protein